MMICNMFVLFIGFWLIDLPVTSICVLLYYYSCGGGGGGMDCAVM